MKSARSPRVAWMLLGLMAITSAAFSQNVINSSLSFSISGSFSNPVKESTGSILVADNNLTDGYASGSDLTDAPGGLATSGPGGSAFFQWGKGATSSAYPHPSALWFEPVSVNAVQAETFFTIGHLYYRNGSINNNSGASSVDLNLGLVFTNPSGLAAQNTSYTEQLINTTNTSDQAASADIVSLPSTSSQLTLTDAQGKKYYLQMCFEVDQSTLDGTLSTQTQFKVFEGMQGSATLLGRFTTDPATLPVPEPSSALLTAATATLGILRRRRKAA